MVYQQFIFQPVLKTQKESEYLFQCIGDHLSFLENHSDSILKGDNPQNLLPQLIWYKLVQ
jgi:hypothetical protein